MSSLMALSLRSTFRPWSCRMALANSQRSSPSSPPRATTTRFSDPSQSSVDRLVINQDPGGTGWRDNENTSRQIVSTRNGLLTASRRYAVKMRSDMARHKPPRGPLDVKLGPGGLVDLEFAVHVLQLTKHVGIATRLRPPACCLA